MLVNTSSLYEAAPSTDLSNPHTDPIPLILPLPPQKVFEPKKKKPDLRHGSEQKSRPNKLLLLSELDSFKKT